jgi:hypothetical protein
MPVEGSIPHLPGIKIYGTPFLQEQSVAACMSTSISSSAMTSTREMKSPRKICSRRHHVQRVPSYGISVLLRR